MWHFIAGQAVGLAVGFVAGAFTPAIGRIISGFVHGIARWIRGESKVIGSKL